MRSCIWPQKEGVWDKRFLLDPIVCNKINSCFISPFFIMVLCIHQISLTDWQKLVMSNVSCFLASLYQASIPATDCTGKSLVRTNPYNSFPKVEQSSFLQLINLAEMAVLTSKYLSIAKQSYRGRVSIWCKKLLLVI